MGNAFQQSGHSLKTDKNQGVTHLRESGSDSLVFVTLCCQCCTVVSPRKRAAIKPGPLTRSRGQSRAGRTLKAN